MIRIPSASELPQELTSAPHWVAWRSETRQGSTKQTKVPYCLATGRPAASTKPADWASYPEGEDLPEGYQGIGFVFTKELGLTGIDLDHCMDAEGNVKVWAARVLQRFSTSYAEISPSGNGVKLWVRAVLPGNGLKVYVRPDGTPGTEAENDGAVEMYDTGRYFTVTAQAIGPLAIADCQFAVDSLYKSLRARPDERPKHLPEGEVVSEGGRHHFLLATAARWRQDGMDSSAILVGLRQLNAAKCTPPKPEFELKGIIDWLASKPPKYRLIPKDFDDAAVVTTGAAVAVPAKEKDENPITGDALSDAEIILTKVIESRDPLQLIEGPLIAALAAAGAIKQHEAKRRLQLVFKPADFPVREWQLRIKEAETKLAHNQQAFTDYILTSEGGLRPHMANAMTMMKALPLAYNAFSCRGVLTAKSPWSTIGNWSDYDDVKALEWCQRQALNIDSKRTIADAANALSRDRTPHHHPVVEYLHSLDWDGTARLDEWLIQYLGCPDNSYVRAVAAKWCMSAVKRVMDPNGFGADREDLGWNQADYTLVLEGPQGKRKSSALRALCGAKWFTASIRDIGTKDSAMQLQGKWIVEIAELDAFRRAEMTTIKAWLVEREDNFRPPYGYRADDFVRQNVFAASTNREDWLNDDTGGRRFWPVKVGENIDVDGLMEARDQLWAEAFFRWNSGEKTYLSEPLEETARGEQSARQDLDAWKDLIEEWLAAPIRRSGSTDAFNEEFRSRPARIFLPEIMWHCLGIPKKDWNQGQKMRVSRILTLAGYLKKRESKAEAAEEDGVQREYWSKMGGS